MRQRHHDARHGRDFGPTPQQQTRKRVALEAARLISETGLRDYAAAKRKAAARLGVSDEFSLPKNGEIEEALREHQRLFHAEDQPRRLRALRETAVEAMRFFAAFEPRLVGAVLDGSADEHSAVCLHLFSDDADAPARHLDEHAIGYAAESRRLRFDKDRETDFPALRFLADGTPIDATIFPYDGLRQAPLDRIDGKPMPRANLAGAKQLLADA